MYSKFMAATIIIIQGLFKIGVFPHVSGAGILWLFNKASRPLKAITLILLELVIGISNFNKMLITLILLMH